MFKTPEELRKDKGLSQMEFCKITGIPFRTYHERLSGERPNWKVAEIDKLCKFSGGKVKVIIKGVEYNITIEQN